MDAAIGTASERIYALNSRLYIPRGEEGVIGSQICRLDCLREDVLMLNVE